jgi:glycosyltransferase involved in cell wall biosynthesis
VESVFAQTYTDWELLLVDDGSTDGSSGLAQKYAELDPSRVCYLEHPGHTNRGISASRNLGVRHSKGVYLAFLDADDVWFPAKLEEQEAILEAHPAVALVYGTALVWYSWNGRAGEAKQDYMPDMGMPPEQVIEPPALLTRLLRRQAHCPPISNAFMRRSAVLEAGLFEEQFRGMHEDQAFLAKLSLRSPLYLSGGCWHKYRQHSDSCLAQASKAERRAARGRFLKWLRNYLAEGGQQGGEVWATVEEQLRPYRLSWRVRSRAVRLARNLLPGAVRSWLKPRGEAQGRDQREGGGHVGPLL